MTAEVPQLRITTERTAHSDAVLEVDRLSVSFDDRVILADLSFTVVRGASLAVIGPNGSGKTVMFQALIGAIPYEERFVGRQEHGSAMCRRNSISSAIFR